MGGRRRRRLRGAASRVHFLSGSPRLVSLGATPLHGPRQRLPHGGLLVSHHESSQAVPGRARPRRASKHTKTHAKVFWCTRTKAYHLLLREELLLRVWHGLRGERVLRKSPRRRRLLLVHGGRLPCQSAGDDLQSFGIRPAAPRAPRLNASRRPPPARPSRRAITGRPSSHTHEPAGAHAPPRGSLSCVCRLADSELTGQALIYLSVYPNKRLIKHADSIRLSLQLAGAASVQLMRAGAPNRRS